MTLKTLKLFIGPRLRKCLALLLVMTACSVSASRDQEYETLTRLLSELQALDSVVKAAKHAAIHGDRQRFDYAALRRDLAKVEAGIADHLTMTRRDPHLLAPLEAEYRR